MSLGVPRVLVFDDNEDDGIKITRALWKSKCAVRFIKYDPVELTRTAKENLKGVRVVIMDIDLIGDGIPGNGTRNFSAVQQALEHVLDKRNGPYILITWSTFDDHAGALFSHLQERMSEKLRPILCERLNKEDYEGGKGNLHTKITKFINTLEATGCLIDWEYSIQNAVCETIFELMNIASGPGVDSINNGLKKILYYLADAEAAKNLTKENALRHTYSVLSQLLFDETTKVCLKNEVNSSKIICSGKDISIAERWDRKINTMLHLDYSDPLSGESHKPGDVFKYPSIGHALPIPNLNTKNFLFEKFVETKKSGRKISRYCLLLIEITPPCDYAQMKFDWHRYVVGAYIPENLFSTNKLPDFRWQSPEFQKGKSSFKIIFNSHFIVSIPPTDHELLGKRIFRIRGPLLNDMMGWLARQLSRQGHVSVSQRKRNE